MKGKLMSAMLGLFLCIASSSPACLASASATTHSTPPAPQRLEPSSAADSTEVSLVLDPTVFTYADAGEFNTLAAELREFYYGLPSRTCVNVFFVRRGRIGAGADMRHCFRFDGSPRGARNHQERLATSFDEIQTRYRALWNYMHSPAQRSLSQSCLLSTIARAGAHAPFQGPQPRYYIVLVSDMLEECDEWRPINLERAAEHQQIPGVDVTRLTNLSHVNAVYARFVHHRRVHTHAGRSQLENFWRQAFQQIRPRRYSIVPLLQGGLLRS